jgi:hypothetical protein
MLLKIIWIVDAVVLIALIASYFLGEPEKGKFAYVFLYIVLIGVSYFIKDTHPKMAMLVAGVPVLIPILVILFLFFAFSISAISK